MVLSKERMICAERISIPSCMAASYYQQGSGGASAAAHQVRMLTCLSGMLKGMSCAHIEPTMAGLWHPLGGQAGMCISFDAR